MWIIYCRPQRAVEIVEFVRKYMDGISQDLKRLTESHKICKVWALINQVFPQYFPSYSVWLSQIIISANISESVDINQSTSFSQFCPIEASNFIRAFLVFPYSIIIELNSFFSTHVTKRLLFKEVRSLKFVL